MSHTSLAIAPLYTRVAQQILAKADIIHRIDHAAFLAQAEKLTLREVVAQSQYVGHNGHRRLQLTLHYWPFSFDCFKGRFTGREHHLRALVSKGYLILVRQSTAGGTFTVNLKPLPTLAAGGFHA